MELDRSLPFLKIVYSVDFVSMFSFAAPTNAHAVYMAVESLLL